jgi:hypothetical protein
MCLSARERVQKPVFCVLALSVPPGVLSVAAVRETPASCSGGADRRSRGFIHALPVCTGVTLGHTHFLSHPLQFIID